MRIKLKKLDNTRDLGGFVTKDGRRVCPKKLIRSGALLKATPKDISVLTDEYLLKTVVDFRTETERAQKPDPQIVGVKNLWCPILPEETLGITRERVRLRDMPKMFDGIDDEPMSYMKKLYRSIVLDEHAQKGYATFFDTLLSQEEGSVLWHCAAGKDRVGVGTALLLTVLGVDRETIIADYLETGYNIRKTNRKLALLTKLFVKGKTGQMLLFLMDVKREYIEAALDAVEASFGTVEAYLEQTMGLTGEKQERLRQKYLA